MKQHVVAFIFARGGSKGVPRKNIRLLAGEPLIAYSISAARASKWIDRVVVSTDDAEIADVARQHGAEVPFMRPVELAQDDSPEWLAWQHALRAVSANGAQPIDVFVSLPTTSPLRAVSDVDDCILALLSSEADIVISVRNAERNPYFNMVAMDEAGYARLVVQPQEPVFRRQAAPPLYDVTTVAYVARPEYILRASGIFDGRVKMVVVPTERALDIDTELDFAIAEFLLRRQIEPSR